MGSNRRGIRVIVGIAVLAAMALLAPVANATLTYASMWWTESTAIYSAHNDGHARHVLFESTPGLVTGGTSHVSPNGRLVVFDRPQTVGGPSFLTVAPAAGGPSRALVQDGMFLAWSPDSRTIAAAVFLPAGPQRERLMLIDARSGAVRTLVDTATIKGASFSPRGDQLAYAAGNGLGSELFTIPVGGGTPINIGDGHRAQWPVWGKSWIAFTRWQQTAKRPELALAKADGTLVREITHTYIPGIKPIDWSASGRRLLLQITRPSVPYAATFDLHGETIRPIGRETRATNHGHSVLPYAISRDGTTVLGTWGSMAKPGGLSVVTLPFKGGKLHTLVRHATYPSWSR